MNGALYCIEHLPLFLVGLGPPLLENSAFRQETAGFNELYELYGC
jgi:hypothetical protein